MNRPYETLLYTKEVKNIMATKVVIKDVIGSYVYLREARENQNGEKDYSMQIILPKNNITSCKIRRFRYNGRQEVGLCFTP